jgi:hypothetical protein
LNPSVGRIDPLPPVPPDLDACFRQAFPNIPERALNANDVVTIIVKAKRNDKTKTQCGKRALSWMNDVIASRSTDKHKR